MPSDQDIIRKWLIACLKAVGRGANKRLAEYLGVRPDAITRMITTKPGAEIRVVSAAEFLRMCMFFESNGVRIPPPVLPVRGARAHQGVQAPNKIAPHAAGRSRRRNGNATAD